MGVDPSLSPKEQSTVWAENKPKEPILQSPILRILSQKKGTAVPELRISQKSQSSMEPSS